MSEQVEGIARMRRILLIYRRMVPSVRLCGHSQLAYLAEQGRLEYRAVQEMKLKAEDLNWADIVLLGRLDSWYEDRLAQLARGAGRYLAYIIDDDLLNIPPHVRSAANYGQREIQGYIRDMIGLSDAIISPSPLLLDKYAGGKRAIQVEEPAIDPVEYRRRPPGGPVKIGFAGSLDRIGDIEGLLKDVLLRIRDEYGGGVAFEFFGANPAFAARLQARCIPYCDSYEAYRHTLNALQWDIGLAPMPDTPFHACKHYNKFGEYAAAGIVGVFSDVHPYTRLRAFPECAVFCENTTEGWVRALKGLIEEPERREVFRREAVRCAREYLSLSRCAEGLEANLPDIASLKPTGSAVRGGLGFMKARNLPKRLFTKARGHGAKGLVEAAGERVRAVAGRRQQGRSAVDERNHEIKTGTKVSNRR